MSWTNKWSSDFFVSSVSVGNWIDIPENLYCWNQGIAHSKFHQDPPCDHLAATGPVWELENIRKFRQIPTTLRS
jgi:hypothetical protein